jgi:predicted transposase/invertase (TIGR01784 family)
MGHELLSPTQDIVFKRIFGDKRNADILANLLSTILPLTEEECSNLTFVNTHQISVIEDGKLIILDVKVVTKDGRIIDIEIQVYRVKAMRARILYYGAGMITEQLKSSEKYSEIKPVVCIVISDFNMIPEETAFHNEYSLNNKKTHKLFSPLFEIHTIELPKIPRDGLSGKDAELAHWGAFLAAKTEEDMNMVAQHSPMIYKAVGIVKELSADEQFRMEAAARLKANLDYNSIMGDAYEDGLEDGVEKGRKEGKQEERQEFLSMLKSGKSAEEIIQMYENQ